MKKVFLLITSCFCAIAMFGQFEVSSSGYSTTNNITTDGVMGIGTGGVITVKSNRVHPNWSSMTNPYGKALIRTDCETGAATYPYSNMLRGQMNFYVKSNGQIYSSGGVLQASATPTLSRSSSSLFSTLSKLKSVQGITYHDVEVSADSPTRSVRRPEEKSELNSIDSATTAMIDSQIEEEQNRKRFGLVAQELEQVFPEVVRTLPDGSKGILYSDLIPVLIESIKELQDSLTIQASEFTSQITSLRQELDEIRVLLGNPLPQNAPQQDNSGNHSSNGMLGQEQPELYQNTPNPFNRETAIAYRLSASASSASIRIYNLNGQQLKKYPLSLNSLTGTVTLSASAFTPGMYIYSLVINNQVIDSKRMTLTD